MNSVCDVKYIDIFFGFLTEVIRNFSACLSKFDVYIRNWSACFEKASFLYVGSYCIPCGIGDHDLVYIIRHARLPKIKKDPKIVTVRSTKNLNNNTLMKDLNELPFELIRASADNPLVKLEIFLS